MSISSPPETPTITQPATGEKYSDAIIGAMNYHQWIMDEFNPYVGKCVLEIGMGHGMSRRLLPPSCKYIGVDFDPENVKGAKANFPDDDFFECDVTDTARMDSLLQSYPIDTIMCVNLLEHIENDRKVVENLLSVLKPGGHLLFFVPAFQSLYTEMDRLGGHYRRYHKEDFPPLVPSTGKIISNHYFNSVGGVGWWANKFAKHKSFNNAVVNTQIVIFDRFIIPIARVVDNLTRGFFGQSLVVVIKKV